MAGFFKRAMAASPKPKPAALKKEHTSAALVGDIARVNMGGAIASQPTKEMRAELEAAGVAMLDDAGLTEWSVTYNKWLEELRQKEGKDASHSWIQLFAAVDKGTLTAAPFALWLSLRPCASLPRSHEQHVRSTCVCL